MPASRSNTCRALVSEPLRSCSGSLASAASSGTERHRKEGTSFSSTFFRRAATPALRKYFWARMSLATCENCAGTSMSASRKTIEPSGFLISLVALRNSISA